MNLKPKVTLIVARDKNNGIGNENELPWYLPDDLKHFKEVTKDSTLIMGRKTFDSLPGILKGRTHVVLTKNIELSDADREDDVLFFTEAKAALSVSYLFGQDIFIIGGSSIYEIFDEYVDEYIITEVEGDYVCDTFYNKDFLNDGFEEVSRKKLTDCQVVTYIKK